MRDINSFSHRIDIGLNIINIWRHFSTKLATFHLAPQYNNIQLLHEELGDNDFYGPRWRSHRGP